MKFINSVIKRLSSLIVVIIFFNISISNVKAEQLINNESYKTNKQIMPFIPKGLEVDSKGNIYIGLAGEINIYNASGVFNNSIRVKTYGVFEMKIDSNDNLNVALVREDKIIVYNKEGYITQEKEDYDNKAYYEYKMADKIKTDSKGNKYELSNVLGYTKVIKITPDGTQNIIYKIPLLLWVLKAFIPIFL
ncbi:hypothetical protein [Candidatus Clostridium radicumherbarum]|uniref:Uncharacterized protein n=1 Tax=Candidatus Clostridium radicumherbarum TaxID=3381662 RepID=A0ABW8TTL8_9CLOT